MTGNDVRALRARLKLTAKQLSDLLGVHPSTVHRWEVARNETRNLKIEPLQMRLLMLLAQEYDQRTEADQTALTAMLTHELAVGGGLRAIYALLRAAFDTRAA
jgi:transcriptional regulator with XRE-family HTH domain